MNAYIQDSELTTLTGVKDSSAYIDGSFELEIHRRGTKFSNSGIYDAVRHCHLAQLQRCIEYGENVKLMDEEFGTTYLLMAVSLCTTHDVEHHYIPIVHELAMAGCDPNLADLNEQTPLCKDIPDLPEPINQTEAVRRGLTDIMMSLLQLGAEATQNTNSLVDATNNAELQKQYKCHTPSLKQAVEQGSIRTVERLIHLWFRINIKTGDEGSKLITFCRKLHGRDHILTDILVTHFNTLECIHYILSGNRKKVADMRTNFNCDINLLYRGMSNPLHVADRARELGHRDLVELLSVTNQAQRVSRDNSPLTVTSTLCIIT